MEEAKCDIRWQAQSLQKYFYPVGYKPQQISFLIHTNKIKYINTLHNMCEKVKVYHKLTFGVFAL